MGPLADAGDSGVVVVAVVWAFGWGCCCCAAATAAPVPTGPGGVANSLKGRRTAQAFQGMP